MQQNNIIKTIIESSKEAILPINEKEVYYDEKITWTYKDGNIIHSDSWNESRA